MSPHTAGMSLYSAEQKTAVLEQLDRILGNDHFSHSKRFPRFLRFVVQEELEGRGDQLKERTIGLEVFGRSASYDTTADPIVRVTAAEIRKRLAQYYQEAASPAEVRISLPTGSYVPHFEWSSHSVTKPSLTELPILIKPEVRSGLSEVRGPLDAGQPVATFERVEHFAGSKPAARRGFHWSLLAVLGVLSLVAGYLAWHGRVAPVSALDKFWSPVLTSGDPIVVCFPQSHLNSINLRDAANPGQFQQKPESMGAVIVDDLQPLVSLSGMLERSQQHYTLIGEDSATLTDLRHGPAIFLGAFDNQWTLRVTRGLRFRFGDDANMSHFWIEDTHAPGQHWSVDRNLQETTNNYRDYAIVARFMNPETGKLGIVVAGIARGGTVAAGEFLTQRENMESTEKLAPKDWQHKNMEFVLSTEIIDGHSAPPRVEATWFW